MVYFRGRNFWPTWTIQLNLTVSSSSSVPIASIHNSAATEELLFFVAEGWSEVAEDPLLDYSEISEKVAPL